MVAGALVARGAITADFAQSAVEQIVEPVTGLAIGAAVVAWSLVQKWKAAK
jgi:uncharacterized membrane protein